MEYLGHSTKFWLELLERAEKLGCVDHIQEIADLRGKLSFCKSRIVEINRLLADK